MPIVSQKVKFNAIKCVGLVNFDDTASEVKKIAHEALEIFSLFFSLKTVNVAPKDFVEHAF